MRLLPHPRTLGLIVNDHHLSQALAVIEELMMHPKLNIGELAYFEVLSGLVQDYENKHHAIQKSSDAQLLAFLIDQKETTAYKVAQETGSRSQRSRM